jgi:hypothetical protein
LSFVFYLSLEASIAFTRDCRACAEKPGREARALAHGLQSRAEDVTVRLAGPIGALARVESPNYGPPNADADGRIF